jgi:uncharacterized protein (TIGR03067 family)
MGKRLQRLLGCCLGVLGLVALMPDPARADDAKKMQGTWEVVVAEVGPNEATKAQLKEFKVTVEGDKFTLKEGDRTYVVHFALNSAVKPAAIDFYKDAAKGEKLWHGIYDFDGKELKLCWGPTDEDRPKRFATNKKNENRHFVLKKED